MTKKVKKYTAYSYTQLPNIKSHQMQIYKMLYNAIVTYVDLTLKIHSTFINETALQKYISDTTCLLAVCQQRKFSCLTTLV